ncbi:hypothetical protein [Desulforegula conservatrix]|uniref:hypothetical protein n=1 Tax=Desulforegula conservatrix TaxID=153026 RepID=UPI00040D5533|nr:hypothetical protein [Desulforegula conservatrix]
MSSFKIEAPGFQTSKKSFNFPSFFIIRNSIFRITASNDNQEFTIGAASYRLYTG